VSVGRCVKAALTTSKEGNALMDDHLKNIKIRKEKIL
jgi:hypothetical protein